MSKRDHYKGIPKSRNVVVDSRNKLKPVSARHPSQGYGLVANSSADYSAETPQFERSVEFFVRNTGNDNNDGLTEGTAVRTLERVKTLLPPHDLGKTAYIINLTGYSYVPNGIDDGSWISGAFTWEPHAGYDGYRLGPPERTDLGVVFYDIPLTFFAAPVLVTAVSYVSDSITSTTAAQTTNMYTITVNETLVPDAHKGEFVMRGGALHTHGVIASNTTNTITVARKFSGAVDWSDIDGIYTQSCTLEFGDDTLSNQWASRWNMMCPVAFAGIKFRYAASSSSSLAIVFKTSNDSFFSMCDFDGLSIQGTPFPHASMFDSVFRGNFILNGSGVWATGCLFTGATMGGHGSGGSGRIDYSACVFDSCSAVGGGNHEQELCLEMTNCHIKNGTSHGILLDSPTRASVHSTYIEGCAGDAIRGTVGGCYARIQDVHGTGNGGYGMYLANGQQILLSAVGGSMPTVSGTSGHIRLGSKDVTWGSARPQTDADNADTDLIEFCRIFE